MSSSLTEVDVVMPQMGVSVAEGTIVLWHKQPGDWTPQLNLAAEDAWKRLLNSSITSEIRLELKQRADTDGDPGKLTPRAGEREPDRHGGEHHHQRVAK